MERERNAQVDKQKNEWVGCDPALLHPTLHPRRRAHIMGFWVFNSALDALTSLSATDTLYSGSHVSLSCLGSNIKLNIAFEQGSGTILSPCAGTNAYQHIPGSVGWMTLEPMRRRNQTSSDEHHGVAASIDQGQAPGSSQGHVFSETASDATVTETSKVHQQGRRRVETEHWSC